MGMTREAALRAVIDMDGYAAAGYPHEAWRWLRQHEPVAWSEVEGYPGFWTITRHADVVALSKAPERFVNAPIMAIFPRAQFEAENFPFRHLINMDPPEHREYRRVVSSYFTPRALATLRPKVERAVEATLEGLRGRDCVDFVHEVSAVMPLVVIADMLGIPEADRQRFFHWSNQVIASADEEYQDEADTTATAESAVRALFDYFRDMCAERRRSARDDLTSVIANARVGGAPIPDLELVSYLALVIVAGNETTRNAASGGLVALMQHPDQLAVLRAEPKHLDAAIEEILRWTSPVVQMARTPIEDFDLRGAKIRAGEPLCLFYASANRDEEIWEDPFAFRVDRRRNPHLAFGVGEHICLGAHLARLELRALFGSLLRTVSHVELDGEISRQRSSFVGGIKHLPVRYRLVA